MLVLAGKVLFGLSLGMASAFVLGATSIGLWTLVWPTIVLTGSVGALFWLIGKATESLGGGSSQAKNTPPPPYEENETPVKVHSKKSTAKHVTPPSSPRVGPTIFVTPESSRRPHVFFSSTPQPHARATTVRRTATVLPTCSTPHPSRVEVRRTAGGPPLMATGSTRVVGGLPAATTVRHVGRTSVRSR